MATMIRTKKNCSMRRLSTGAMLVLLCGCSTGPGSIAPPDVDASAAAAAAIEEFDRNDDSALDSKELANCPALAYALPRYDSDGDRVLSNSEIEAGIVRWKATAVGAKLVPFAIQMDGRALAGAQVKLVPEKFLDGAVKPATGESGAGGTGYLDMAAEDRPDNAPDMPIVQPGLYRVEITHPSRQIPARYNSSTTLGLEVARDSILPQGVVWALMTK